MIDDAEYKENYKRKSEVHKRRDVLGEQEQILRHIDLVNDRSVADHGSHAVVGRFLEIRHNDRARKKIDRIMRCCPSEELSKHDLHNKEREQRRQDTPGHAENGAFILVLKIALNKLLKKEPVRGKPR